MEIQFRETQNCHILWEGPGCECSIRVVLLTVVPQVPHWSQRKPKSSPLWASRKWELPSNPTWIWRWTSEARQRGSVGWSLTASSSCDCSGRIILEFPLLWLFSVIVWGNTNSHNRHSGWPDKIEQMSKHQHSKRYTIMPEFVFFFFFFLPPSSFWVGKAKQKASDISRYFYFKPLH